MEIKVDINICRICLKANTGYSLFHEANQILIEKFQFLTQLKILKNDGMPSLFCNNCVAKLKLSYDFRRLCLKSDIQMKAFLSKINNDFKQFTNNATDTISDSDYNETEMSILLQEGYKIEETSQDAESNNNDVIVLQEHNTNQNENEEEISTPLHLTSAVESAVGIDDFTKYIQEDETEEEDANDIQSNCEQGRENYLIESNEDIQMELREIDNENDNMDADGENSILQEDVTEEMIEVNVQNNNSVHTEENVEDSDDILTTTSGILFIQSDSNIQEEYRMNDIIELPVDDQKEFLKNEQNQILAVNESTLENEIFSNASTNSEDFKITYPKNEVKVSMNDSHRNINRTHICIKCDKDFSTKTNLMRHMQTHDGIKPYQCNICGNGFTQNGSLKAHMLIHTGERPHQCNVCGRGFTQSKSLTFHMRRHTGEKPFSCETCGLNFRQKDGLKRHEQIKHTGAPPESHICVICNRILHSRYSLQLHMRRHNSSQNDAKIFECSECDKKFQTRFALSEHQRTHTGEKPFKCNECDKEFSRKTSLITHLRTHQDIKHFKCELCSKEFASLKEYELHSNNHENNSSSKIFQCGKCFKSFSIKRNLLQHLRNHNIGLVDLYKCNDCSIGFNTKRDLKLHRYSEHKEIVTDLNECEYCNIPFVNAYDLNQHINNVHDSIDEKCEICLENFTSKKLLDDHMLEHEILTIA